MKSKLLLCFLLLLISSCGTKDRGCRSGDNFDGNGTEIQSYFDSKDLYYRDDSNVDLSSDFSVVKWQDTGLLTNGKKIVVCSACQRIAAKAAA